MSKTANDFRQAAATHAITYWESHRCSLCHASVGYVIDTSSNSVGYDSNCYCVSYATPMQPRSWEDLVNRYNMQSPEVQKCFDEFWHFEEAS